MGLNVDANILALLALLGSMISGGLTFWLNLARLRGQRRTVSAQTAIEGYDKLCQDLSERLDKNQAELRELEGALARLRAEYAADRDRWAKERAELEARIAGLQAENVELRRRLDEMQGGK